MKKVFSVEHHSRGSKKENKNAMIQEFIKQPFIVKEQSILNQKTHLHDELLVQNKPITNRLGEL